MKTIAISAIVTVLLATNGFSQKAPQPPTPPAKEKTESIIIHKNGDSKEKTTIVIDGDKVTVNGKPVEDYKKNNIEIIRDNDSDLDFLPPMPPHGGAKMFTRNFTIHSNDAMLGIMPEDAANGAKITEVTKGGAAEKAGLKEDDVITAIGDKKINDADDVYDAIGKHKPEDKVAITYLRDNKSSTTTATLDKNTKSSFSWNSDNNFAPRIANDFNKNFVFSYNKSPRMGARVQDAENGDGVKVIDIDDEDSPAAKAGLKEDDVITQVNGKPVKSVKDIKNGFLNAKPGDSIQLQYQRNGTTQTATVHLPKPLQTSDL